MDKDNAVGVTSEERARTRPANGRYSLNGWVYGPVGLIQEREPDRLDGVDVDFHGVAVSETSHTMHIAQRHGDIAASRCRPGNMAQEPI